MAKKYCDGIDCQWCSEKEPCIYKIANRQAEIIEEIKDITSKNLQTNLCSSCDGVGLYEGCEDTSCSYYQMNKILHKCEEVK